MDDQKLDGLITEIHRNAQLEQEKYQRDSEHALKVLKARELLEKPGGFWWWKKCPRCNLRLSRRRFMGYFYHFSCTKCDYEWADIIAI